jgi:hypothetical protein
MYLIVSWNSSGTGFTRQAFPPLKHVRFPLATPGTEACDAMGGAFSPQWRELPPIMLRLSLQCCPKPVRDRCQARRSLPTSRHIGTSQFPDERIGDFSTAETLASVRQRPISNQFIHVLRRLSQPESLRARRV